MLGYYKRTLISLFSLVQELRVDPWSDLQTCLAIQETLLQRIVYVEKRIQTLRGRVRDNRKYLRTKRSPMLTRAESEEIKEKIDREELTVKEYQYLLHVFRSIGDALAYIYLPKWDIKPLTLKQPSGFISGKKGLGLEREILRFAFQRGAPAILNDLTNSLRYGDVTVLKHESPPLFMEVKSKHDRTGRARRQVEEIAEVMSYLSTGQGMRNGYTVHRAELSSPERNYVLELNQLLGDALRTGFAFSKMEPGLYYYAQTDSNCDRFQSIMANMGESPMAFPLTSHKQGDLGFYPYTLSITNPEALFAFYKGSLVLIVFIEPEIVAAKLSSHGLSVSFEDDDLWALTISSQDASIASELGPMQVSRHFFFRVPREFLSLDWFLNELAEMDFPLSMYEKS